MAIARLAFLVTAVVLLTLLCSYMVRRLFSIIVLLGYAFYLYSE